MFNAQWGFHPSRFGPPNMLPPEQVLCHHHVQRRGGPGGQALYPVILPVLCISFRAKGILQSLFTVYFMNRLIVTRASVGDYL